MKIVEQPVLCCQFKQTEQTKPVFYTFLSCLFKLPLVNTAVNTICTSNYYQTQMVPKFYERCQKLAYEPMCLQCHSRKSDGKQRDAVASFIAKLNIFGKESLLLFSLTLPTTTLTKGSECLNSQIIWY